MKRLLLLMLLNFVASSLVHSQGCIVVRNISGFGQYNLTNNAFTTSSWQININNRYFKAYRDFKGKKDIKTPPANQNIIKSFSTDIEVAKLFNKGWSLDFSLPISANSRSSTLEHGGPNTPRHATHAFGVGDATVAVYKWLISPSVRQRGNIQLGLGIKLPTGDYKYQDYFYRNDSTRVLSAVNPAIQLGDGGTGIITELNTFYFFNSKRTVGLYGNFYYLINPRDINGTQYTMGKPLDPFTLQIGAYENSVPDVFSFRAGVDLNLNHWAFSAGIRDEGSPVRDLIGQSNGSRRAGYTLSVEPGIIYKFKNATVYTYVPFTVSHSISQNLVDKQISKHTGVYTVSAGGSGDYQVFVGVQVQL
ncbi:MAG: hypothetical protein ABI472_21340 [Ginsengibacter sp.]